MQVRSLDVQCPRCGNPIGRPCGPEGKRGPRYHHERHIEAMFTAKEKAQVNG